MSDGDQEHPLAAFAAALGALRETMTQTATERCRVILGGSLVSSEEQFRAARAQNINDYLDALVDPEAKRLHATTAGWVAVAAERGTPKRLIYAVQAAISETLLEGALSVHRAGVPRASEGIRRLFAVTRERVRLFDEAFRAPAEETLRTTKVLEALLENAPDGIGVSTPEGEFLYANPSFYRLLGERDLSGQHIDTLLAPASQARVRDEVRPAVVQKGWWSGQLTYICADGSLLEAQVTAFAVRDATGRSVARCAILRDTGQARLAEEERRRLAEEVIAAQKRALEEQGTPLVPIAEGVLVMPLVGRIDAARAERMLVVLLSGIDEQGARVVLLDLTGVRTADMEAASALAKATQAARLLGTEVVLTGIRPELARMFVELDAHFAGLAMKGSLRDGVSYALGRMRRG